MLGAGHWDALGGVDALPPQQGRLLSIQGRCRRPAAGAVGVGQHRRHHALGIVPAVQHACCRRRGLPGIEAGGRQQHRPQGPARDRLGLGGGGRGGREQQQRRPVLLLGLLQLLLLQQVSVQLRILPLFVVVLQLQFGCVGGCGPLLRDSPAARRAWPCVATAAAVRSAGEPGSAGLGSSRPKAARRSLSSSLSPSSSGPPAGGGSGGGGGGGGGRGAGAAARARPAELPLGIAAARCQWRWRRRRPGQARQAAGPMADRARAPLSARTPFL